MKPLKLTMHNIASFTGTHTIDFCVLDDMFLICGKTGSGKTTILDSITYALYGSLPGARKQNDIRKMRSDFCTNQDECSIDFEFSLNGKIYRVLRTLPVIRTGRGGKTVEDGESAALYCVHNGTNTSANTDAREEKLLCSRKAETDAMIKSLVRLSAEEFSRIVLLPQGDFADFLRQKSSERKEMLAKLFPVEHFTRCADRLKEEKNRIESMLEEVSSNLERIGAQFNSGDAQREKTELNGKLEDLSAQNETIRRLMLESQTQFTLCEQKLHALKEYEQLQQELHSLLEQKDQYEKNTELLLLIRSACALENFAENAAASEAALYNAQSEYIGATQKLDALNRELKELEKQKSGNEQNKQNKAGIETRLQNMEYVQKACEEFEQTLRDAGNAEQSLRQAREAIERIKSQLTPLESEYQADGDIEQQMQNVQNRLLLTEYELLCAQKKRFEDEEKEQTEDATKAQLILDDFLEQQENENRLSQACLLAKTLQKDTPCPVCGSLAHPAPAQQNQQSLDIGEKINVQKKLCEQAQLRAGETRLRIKEIDGRIAHSFETVQQFTAAKDLEEPVQKTENEISAERENLKQHADELKTRLEKRSRTERYIQDLQNKLEPLKQNEILYSQEYAVTQDRQKQAQQRFEQLLHTNGLAESFAFDTESDFNGKSGFIKMLAGKLQNELLKLNADIEAYEYKYAQTVKEHADLSGRTDILKSHMQNCEVEQKTKENALKQALDSSPFAASDTQSALENMHNVLVQKENLAFLESYTEQYKTEKQRLEVLCAEKKANAQNDPGQLQNEYEQLKRQTAQLENDFAQNQSGQTEIKRRIAELETLGSEYDNLEKRRLSLLEQAQTYTKLCDAVTGKNPKKTPLDAWVLRMYLEEITLYAGRKLENISDGRYTMYLKETEGGRGYQGLDLEVYDSYTGKRRPCSTLSGGETFMASISLALAVSDTVQARNGGIQLDSLFIDEGFGTLDGESLEKALSVLDEIREGRCIGLVSHVDGLKTRIQSRLEIHKGINGSSIQTVQA